MRNQTSSRDLLIDLFHFALKEVNGRFVVEEKLRSIPIEGKVAVVAIGKAACSMFSGVKNQLNKQIQSALVITKLGYGDANHDWPCFETGHPVPNDDSLLAGQRLLEFISTIPSETTLLALISGGASSLVDVLPDELNLEDLQKINNWLLGSGLTIHEINQVRQSVSKIKGGKLLNFLRHKKMTQLLISDVRNDDPAIIGSGLFVKSEYESTPEKIPGWIRQKLMPGENIKSLSVDSHIVANNEMACKAVSDKSKEYNYAVTYHGQTLYGDVFEIVDMLFERLIHAEPGLHIWGGETTIVLPNNPGRGGRNQSLALALASRLDAVQGITVLVGATDGTDVPTEDAGAIIDGLTLQRGKHIGKAKEYLTTADAGTFLAETGDLISTGVTGTNVMDLVIALKEPA